MAKRTSCALILTLISILYKFHISPLYMYVIWYITVIVWFLVQNPIISDDSWTFLNEKTIFLYYKKIFIFDKKNFINFFLSNLIEKNVFSCVFLCFLVFSSIFYEILRWENPLKTHEMMILKYIILIIFKKKKFQNFSKTIRLAAGPLPGVTLGGELASGGPLRGS